MILKLSKSRKALSSLGSNARLRTVQHLLEKIGIRNWVGPKCKIKVEYIDAVRDFKGWFPDCNKCAKLSKQKLTKFKYPITALSSPFLLWSQVGPNPCHVCWWVEGRFNKSARIHVSSTSRLLMCLFLNVMCFCVFPNLCCLRVARSFPICSETAQTCRQTSMWTPPIQGRPCTWRSTRMMLSLQSSDSLLMINSVKHLC